MKRLVLYFCILFNSYLSSQNRDPYELDSIFHKSELLKLSDKYETNEKFYFTSYKFVNNESFLFVLKNDTVEVIRLTNKKFSKKVEKQKVQLKIDDKDKIIKVLNGIRNKSFILDSNLCFNYDTVHYYIIEVDFFNKKHIVSSKCLAALRNNKDLAIIFKAIQKQ